MINRQQELGGPVVLTFSSPPENDNDYLIILDGESTTITASVALVAGNIHTLSFIPESTGIYDIVVDSVVIASIEVVSRNVFSFLKNIEDSVMGSWEWNKSTKEMTLLRLDGTVLAVYSTDDNPEEAYHRYINT